jgi:hypothetical protein
MYFLLVGTISTSIVCVIFFVVEIEHLMRKINKYLTIFFPIIGMGIFIMGFYFVVDTAVLIALFAFSILIKNFAYTAAISLVIILMMISYVLAYISFTKNKVYALDQKNLSNIDTLISKIKGPILKDSVMYEKNRFLKADISYLETVKNKYFLIDAIYGVECRYISRKKSDIENNSIHLMVLKAIKRNMMLHNR